MALASGLRTSPARPAPHEIARPAAVSPSPSPSDPDSLRIRDDRGHVLVLPEPARRIVSLVPAATEILFAIGAGDRVVGRTRFSRHPPQVREVPSVGDGIRPSAELVLARRPDAVIVFAGPDNAAAVWQLERLGLPVLAVRHNSFADLYRNIDRLGRLTGREASADSLAEAIRTGLRKVAARVAGLPVVRAYLETWPDPPYTIGAGSYLDSLLRVAGGRNVFEDLAAPSPQVSLEAIALRDPDVFLLPVRPGGSETPPAERPGWDAVRAVRQGRVRRVDADLVERLGPRVGAAAAELARALHPELAGPGSAADAGRGG